MFLAYSIGTYTAYALIHIQYYIIGSELSQLTGVVLFIT